MKIKKIKYEHLRKFGVDIFHKIGYSKDDAHLAADVLLQADLRGIDSHGYARLSGYVRLWKKKRINTQSQPKVIYETPSTAVLDADRGIGLVVGSHAMRIAIEKAKQCGTGWVAVKNSTHFGIAAYHAMLALSADMIGITMTNASPLVAPTFAQERLLGTNPICVAIPAGKQPPFVADFATSTAANGKIEVLARKGEPIPEGWLQDESGKSTTDPKALQNGGYLTPLGGDSHHGSHKGFCLGAWVDIFSSVLSGANYGPWVPPFINFLPIKTEHVGEGIGHFFGVLRPDAFRPLASFKKDMDQWINRFQQAKTVAGQKKVIIPGTPEREQTLKRKQNGIPLHEKVQQDLIALGKEFGIPFCY